MTIPLSQVKILKNEYSELILAPDWVSLLLSGDFYEFEKQFHESMMSLYNKVCQHLIVYISGTKEFISAQRAHAKEVGMSKLETRSGSIQLRTGAKINYPSLYAKEVKPESNGTRHLSSALWGASLSSSPMYSSLMCLYSVVCPSFSTAKSLLNYQGITANFDRVRQLSLDLANQGMKDRSSVQLSPDESLADKRVIIGMDGGRTRTRAYKDGHAKRGNKFSTPWREPKLFVITTVDENGKINKERKPIYDCTFGDDETFELLRKYLTNLDIDKATHVQFLADGAPWIWNRVRPMLIDLGVDEGKITETLDYYHAMEHLHEMKIYFDKDKKEGTFELLKEALWRGDFEEMTSLIKQAISGVNLEEFNPYKYFYKQRNRIDYQSLRLNGSPCGSGIVESGIRRIINLRFKAPSSFWYLENVEKLIFMRGIALSGRWEIMMRNLTQNHN